MWAIVQSYSGSFAFLWIELLQGLIKRSEFCLILGKSFVETFQMLQTAYGNEVLSQSRCHEWFKRFNVSQQSVEDDNRPGPLFSLITRYLFIMNSIHKVQQSIVFIMLKFWEICVQVLYWREWVLLLFIGQLLVVTLVQKMVWQFFLNLCTSLIWPLPTLSLFSKHKSSTKEPKKLEELQRILEHAFSTCL